MDEMNVARGLKLQDLILSFLLLSRSDIGLKTFFALIMYVVLILCDFSKFGCLRILVTSQKFFGGFIIVPFSK